MVEVLEWRYWSGGIGVEVLEGRGGEGRGGWMDGEERVREGRGERERMRMRMRMILVVDWDWDWDRIE